MGTHKIEFLCLTTSDQLFKFFSSGVIQCNGVNGYLTESIKLQLL